MLVGCRANPLSAAAWHGGRERLPAVLAATALAVGRVRTDSGHMNVAATRQACAWRGHLERK